MTQHPYEKLEYVVLALDPIHIGTGGYRLGRVDMSIVREPGTNLPKIPGTSLAGACRTYAAMQMDGKFPDCAGQGGAGEEKQGHCGDPACAICATFGFAGERSFQGLAQFSDARLLLFPVHSLAGPIWVTCPEALRDWGVAENEPTDGTIRVPPALSNRDRLNLGWLLLMREAKEFSLEGRLKGVSEEILRRAVLVSTSLFSHIVNDNLEVRTSVSIDPKTGAATGKALYTYEALPRSTVLAFEVVVSDPKYYRISGQEPLGGDMGKVKQTVASGLDFCESLGIGGMNTRGMGRMKVTAGGGL